MPQLILPLSEKEQEKKNQCIASLLFTLLRAKTVVTIRERKYVTGAFTKLSIMFGGINPVLVVNYCNLGRSVNKV